jgi:hypothetical protein
MVDFCGFLLIMDFRLNSDAQYTNRYHVTFSPDEAEAVSAAYSEHVHELAVKGNSGSISDFATSVASWKCNPNQLKSVYTNSVGSINEVLNAFFERTADVIAELPDTTLVPAFRNKDIGLRQALGEKATQLAEELAQNQATLETVSELRELPETHERH